MGSTQSHSDSTPANDVMDGITSVATSVNMEKTQKATTEVSETLLELQEKMQGHADLTKLIREIASEYRPVSVKTLAAVSEIQSLAASSQERYVPIMKQFLAAGDVDGVRTMIEQMQEHLGTVEERFKEVQSTFNGVGFKVSDCKDKAKLESDRLKTDADNARWHKDNAAGVGLGGAGVALGALAVATGPVGMSIAALAVAVEVGGLAAGAGFKASMESQEALATKCKKLAETMEVIKKTVDDHMRELVWIRQKLGDTIRNNKQLKDFVGSYSKSETYRTLTNNTFVKLVTDYKTLEQSCKKYIATEEKCGKDVEKRLALK